MWQGWVNGILGIWLSLAPLVSMDIPSVKLNNLYLGVVAAVVSGYTPSRKPWECWLGIAGGSWIAFSSLIPLFVHGPGYLWSNIAVLPTRNSQGTPSSKVKRTNRS